MEGGFMVQKYKELIHTWPSIALFLAPPRDDHDLERLISLSHYLIDQIGENENHYLNSLLDTVGTLILEYENRTIPEPEGDPIGCLKYLMEEHGLIQKDLTELGSPGVVSEILSGKRELNKRQIKALSKRFKCNPSVFI